MRARHAIQSVELDVVVQSKAEGNQLYDHLHQQLDRFWNDIGDKLEYLTAQDQWIIIDQLELSLGHVSKSDIILKLEKAFIEAIETRIISGQYVSENLADGSLKIQNAKQKLAETFGYFLEWGYFDWDCPVSNITELEEYLVEEIREEGIRRIWMEVIKSDQNLYRFIHQFSSPIKIELIISLIRQEKQSQPDYGDAALTGQLRRVLEKGLSVGNWYAIYKEAASYSEEEPVDSLIWRLIKVCDKSYKENSAQDFGDIFLQGKRAISENLIPSVRPGESGLDRSASLFVEGAGVILIHPFLQTFFTHIGLLKENRFEQYRDHSEAVYLLHYITTGRTEAKEFELVFSKFLLNYPIENPLLPRDEFPEEWISQSQKMLEAVIRNWGALKNTSIEGLRSTFFERSGKVTLAEHGYKLQLEKKGVDILLQYLPWSISVVQLPWLPDPIFVEWV